METLETFGGNSKPQKFPETNVKTDDGNSGNGNRCVPGKRWCFTAYNEDIENLKKKLTTDSDVIKYVMGNEICPSTGRKHLQGFFEIKKKIRPSEYLKTKSTRYFKAEGNDLHQVTYCTKDKDFISKGMPDIPEKLEDPMDGLELYEWQKEIKAIINGPVQKRKIHWYWEEKGNVGKSSFAKHLCMEHKAIYVTGKGDDIKYAIAEMLSNGIKIVIWDIPRIVGNNISYTAIEEISNGMIFNTKYESGMHLFNPPHLIVFANEAPKEYIDGKLTLSKDRWNIKNIDTFQG